MYKIVSSSKSPLQGDTWENSFLKDYEWIVLEKVEPEAKAMEPELHEKPKTYFGVLNSSEQENLLESGKFLQKVIENMTTYDIQNTKLKDERPFKCDICSWSFKQQHNLLRHKQSHDSKKPENKATQKKVPCDVCGKSFFDQPTLIRHKRLHTGERPFECEICLKAFARKDNFNSHYRLHFKDNHYLCGIHDRQISSKPQFKTKKRLNVANCHPSFQCDTCHKKFLRENSLHVHRRIHLPFKCEMCHQSFSMKRQLDSHLGIPHLGSPQCKLCCDSQLEKCDSMEQSSNGFPSSFKENHAFQCDQCQKPFAVRSNLLEHLRMHAGIKPFQCGVCFKKFSNRGYLNVHMRIHTGEKPYKCDKCPKAFIEKKKLTIHSRSHSGIKPYECMICAKKFFRREYLKSHYRVHTGERPFECEICHKFFTEGSARNKHRKTHFHSQLRNATTL